MTGEESSAVWVRTDPTPDGTAYVVTIEASEDRSRILSPAEAATYAIGVLEAAARASYDAAILAQLTGKRLGLPLETAAQVVRDLRADLPPAAAKATYPLRLVPGVSQRSREPFLAIWLDDEQLGQWSPADARGHALHVLESVTVADLDSAYLRTLVGVLGIEEPLARSVVGDIANHRQDES